jgi:hypothetical protein
VTALKIISEPVLLSQYNDYGLDDRGSIPGTAPRVQTGAGAYPASYPTGTWGSYPEGKAAGTWSSPFTSS